MFGELVKLDLLDLGLSLVMIGGVMALSRLWNLRLEGKIFLAGARTLLQLLVMAYVLAIVWQINQPIINIITLIVLLFGLSIATTNRISKKNMMILPIVATSLSLSTLITLTYTLLFVIHPPHWYDAQYLVSFGGIILSYLMNSAVIAGEKLINLIENNTLEIETLLCLGATPNQAIAPYQQTAIVQALSPNINTMMTVGLLTFPSLMSGQLIAGISPIYASAYQIIWLFMLLFSNAIAVSLITIGISKKMFNQNQQLINN